MAKKLVYNYTFNASSQTLVVDSNFKLRTLQLITNVTDGEIIYNFADPNKGGTTSYSTLDNKTTITLEYDTTSMSDSDELQIFIDTPHDQIEFSETFVDPVSKLRVSNPENLIDTDFEYGLQPTKWETVELVNNIPSVYTRAPGVSIPNIISVNCILNSELITVTTVDDHGLSIGDAIEVRGLSSRTANGKYLITQIPSLVSFNYKASSIQPNAGNIITAYSTIIPGSFFTGSSIEYNHFEGINTDGLNPSTLTVTTDYSHGFSTSTSMYITNTVGKKTLKLESTTTSTAPDGDPYVDTSTSDFYVPLHGFYDDQQITISSGTGGAIPTTSSSPGDPNTANTITSVYNAVVGWADSKVATMISNQDHSRLLMNYNGSSKYYCDNDQYILPNTSYGNLSWQEYRIGVNPYTDYIYFLNNSTFLSYYLVRWSNFANSSALFNGTAVDLGTVATRSYVYSGQTTHFPANLSNLGFYFISTPYTYNQFTNHITRVYQIPSFTSLNAALGGGQSVNRARSYLYDYNGQQETITNSTYKYLYEQQTPITIGTWEFTYGVFYHDARSAYRIGSYTINVFLQNTNWTDHYRPSSHNITAQSSYGINHSNYSDMGPVWHIQTIMLLDDGHTFNNFYGSSIALADATALAQAVITALTPPTLADGDLVKVGVIDDNRIQIRDSSTGTPFNFSSAGTAPINFVTGQTFGIADDYYDITGVTTTTKSITANSQLSPRVIPFVNTDVLEDTLGSNYYIYFTDGHGISDGQKVVFNKTSGADITGIISGTTYYAHSKHSQYIGLSTNVIDWNSGTLAIGNTQISAGEYNLTVNSISGRVASSGTVTSSTSSKVITGVDTKFTSAYSIGDLFVLEGAGQYGPYREGTIASIVSDSSLTLENNAGVSTVGGKHFVDTKLNVRADGTFIHRPFDGGVDITAGTSPDSKVIRQTRKYFRYQSGKGIQCSMAINFNPYRQARLLTSSGTTSTITTEYPHGLSIGDIIKVKGATVSSGINHYNGTSLTVSNVSSVFQFDYTMPGDPSDDNPGGIVDYTINSYNNAGIRAGLFDDQNGMFYEYDGSEIYCVRRSSTSQIPGTITTQTNSNSIIGTNTKFQNHLSVGDMIVIRGQSHKVTKIDSDTDIDIQPKYRGKSTIGVIITKTIDTRVARSNWTLDQADGNGPSGFDLDLNTIQMVYVDYSWYGAGKIRFGFKDTLGHVKYMHEFIHNNRINEAYMRTGNIPARYEVFNTGIPTYVPSLFHWGTSVIMDGGFDDDDSYLFTASGNSLSFTNGDSNSATTNAAGVTSSSRVNWAIYNHYLELSFPTSDASKFSNGVQLYTAGGELSGESVEFTQYSGGSFKVYIFLQQGGKNPPAVYPIVANSTAVNIGAPVSGGETVDVSGLLPLVSLRLAPSVDNNLIGAVGERDIINRMQLKLNELGISVSHDARISVILNGALSNIAYGNVGSPSLSQFVSHDSGDTIQDGTTIYQFRASGGAIGSSGERTVSSQTFDLTRLIDLGNSILGGDGVFPNGPDIITICASALDTTSVNSSSPFQVSSRISWSESQA